VHADLALGGGLFPYESPGELCIQTFKEAAGTTVLRPFAIEIVIAGVPALRGIAFWQEKSVTEKQGHNNGVRRHSHVWQGLKSITFQAQGAARRYI